MNNFVQNNVAGTREARGAVWLTKHGSDEIHSVSTGTYPPNGSDSDLYRQIVEGTVLCKRLDDGLHYPMAYDSAQAVVSSANVIQVADVLQFAIGQVVELPTSVSSDADRFRLITDIDYDNSTITLDGAAFSLAVDDAIEVDSGRSFGVVPVGGGATSATVQLSPGQAAFFQVGDTVDVGDDAANTVDAVDTGADTITLSGSITYADGDNVVSTSDARYKVTNKTVTIDEWEFDPQNVLVPCRPHGRLKEILVIGLTPTAKTALQGLLIFDNRTIA